MTTTPMVSDLLNLTESTSREITVEVSALGKTFRKHSEPAKTLKERLLTLRKSTVDDFDALSNIDFKVYRGETFGILGHNGSGKSTLLKCIAATIRPTEGLVRVRGRLSALLELGAGFHPDLTGKENVYLNGSILGFSRSKIDDIFDEIVRFAELEDFIHTQVKHYSSGMYARLGFAVAVNLEPDVLLIDEVLAVGDEAFQRKCIERIHGFQAAGRTICLVTHSAEQVRNLCDRAMVLDHGEMIYIGDVDEAISAYRQSLGARAEVDTQPEPDIEVVDVSPVRLSGLHIEPPTGGGESFAPGDRVVISTGFDVDEPVGLQARLMIHRDDGALMVNVTIRDLLNDDLQVTSSEDGIRFVLDDLPFSDGRFLVSVLLFDPAGSREFDRSVQQLEFSVESSLPVHGPTVLDLTLETGVTA